MKRSIYIFLALLLVGSCSEDATQGSDIGVVDGSQSMEFAVALTRGETVSSEDEMGSVGIYCARTAEESWDSATTYDYRMTDTQLSYDSTDGWWYYPDGEEKTWGHESQSEKFSFFGYSPYDTSCAVITLTDGGSMQLDYTMPTDCSYQVDLLVAEPRVDITPQVGGLVYLTFYHLLSSVKVEVTNLDSELKVSSIKISDIYSKGIATINNNTSDSDYIIADWEYDTTTATATATMSTDSYTAGELFMLMPQTLTESVTLTITFSDTETDTDTYTKEVTLSDLTPKWEIGTSYTYSYDYAADKADSDSLDSNTLLLDDKVTADDVEALIDEGYTFFVVTKEEGSTTTDLTTLYTLLANDNVTGLDLSDIDISGMETVTGNGTNLENYSSLLSSWSNITTLVLPSNITSISSNTYSWIDRTSLKILDMSATGITTITADTFKEMAKLETIIFPEGVKTIGDAVINSSTTLVNVYLFSSSVSIEDTAFKDLQTTSKTLQMYLYENKTYSNDFDEKTTIEQHPYYTYEYNKTGDIDWIDRWSITE